MGRRITCLFLLVFCPLLRAISLPTASVVKLISFERKTNPNCNLTPQDKSARQGSALLVRLSDKEIVAITSSHVPFHGTWQRGICDVGFTAKDTLAFDLLAVDDLIDLAVLRPRGTVPANWVQAAIPLASFEKGKTAALGDSISMLGYPFSSDRPAIYPGTVDMLGSLRSTLVGARVTEVSPTAGEEGVASEFGMSGGASFIIDPAGTPKFAGLITAQYLEYPAVVPMQARVVERDKQHEAEGPVKTLLLPPSVIARYLHEVIGHAAPDIRLSLSAQKKGERTIQFSGLAFTEMKCGHRTVLEGIRQGDVSRSSGDVGGANGGGVGGANGGGVGGAAATANPSDQEGCTVQVSKADPAEGQSPWPFSVNRGDIEKMNRYVDEDRFYYIVGTRCPGEKDTRVIQNLHSLFYELQQSCTIIFQDGKTFQSQSTLAAQKTLADESASLKDQIGLKEQSIVLAWSRLQPATRQVFWSHFDDEAKREVATLVLAGSPNLYLRKELEQWTTQYARQSVANLGSPWRLTDQDYVRRSFASRYWLLSAAENGNDEGLYQKVYALGRKYPIDQNDFLFQDVLAQTVRDDIWRVYTSPRTNLFFNYVDSSELTTSVSLGPSQKVGALFVFTTAGCAMRVELIADIDTPDSFPSFVKVMVANRDGYQEVMHASPLGGALAFSRLRMKIERDTSLAPVGSVRCAVALQATDRQLQSMSLSDQTLEQPTLDAFSWASRVALPAPEKAIADPLLEDLLQIRALRGRLALNSMESGTL